MKLKHSIMGIIKDLSLATGVYQNTLFDVYPYMYEPHQLEFLLGCLRETANVQGACVEVGCGYGATTVFLRKYLDRLAAHKTYIAIDTFSGFVEDHVRHEVEARKKDPLLAEQFRFNKIEWVSQSIALAGIVNVDLVRCDTSKYDFESCKKISFCLIDMDLYKPISVVLPKIYSELSKGGVIVVDDCQPHPMWDGALAAYEEFVRAHGLTSQIVCEKLGVVRKGTAK